MNELATNMIRGFGGALVALAAVSFEQQDAVSYAELPAAVQSVAVRSLDAQGQDAPPIPITPPAEFPSNPVPPLVAAPQAGVFDAPETSCAVHFAEAMESGKKVILVFYWPTEAVKASRGVKRFNQYDGYVTVPMCIIDPWVGDTLVGQHWDMCQLSAWLYIDGGLTPIETLRQLETN